ncbi:unnamed protein product [Phytophthora fragariaefolia]|uniref:Unnamed protein product n=1 Tax=Phytophthora fragariaefolia TaxID=1490495 RepID=A0A9W6XKE2_9STRA|nr:unnamed protein product [Phytophthora fragariaefolia]
MSSRWVAGRPLPTTKFSDKNVSDKFGDNRIVEAALEALPPGDSGVLWLDDTYKCVAEVYAISDEFDCILGIAFLGYAATNRLERPTYSRNGIEASALEAFIRHV